MENLKIKVNTPEESKEAQELFFELGYEWHGAGKSVSYLESITSGEFEYLVAWKPGCFSKHIIQMGCGKEEAREVSFPQLRDMVVLHRNDVNDANYSITVASDRPDTPVYKTSDDLYYTYSENNGKWVLCRSIASTTTGLKPITKETPNNIARTAEDHREHNLANELNDLCAEFGCPPGADRMRWLRDRLRGTRKPETLYHYSASINTARGTVAYDGVITFPGRITGIDDYQQVRAEIAKDGNVAPEQVNVHSLSIVG